MQNKTAEMKTEKYLKLRSKYYFSRESTFMLRGRHLDTKYCYVERFQY